MAAKTDESKQRAQQQKHVAKQRAKGVTNISGMKNIVAKATAKRKVAETRNGPKASETDHLNKDAFSGKHHASTSYASAMKNAKGGDASVGKHSRENYSPKHSKADGGGYMSRLRDHIGNGGVAVGRHADPKS